MSENHHALCPFCGGTDLIVASSLGTSPNAAHLVTWVLCCESNCRARGPRREANNDAEAIAAAWEAWDAAEKREDAK